MTHLACQCVGLERLSVDLYGRGEAASGDGPDVGGCPVTWSSLVATLVGCLSQALIVRY